MTRTDLDESARASARRRAVQEAKALDLVPFGWERTPPVPVEVRDEEAMFRFPAPDDPSPSSRRLLIMSLYSSLLGLGGVGVGVRGLVSQIGGGVPFWYSWVLALFGLTSVTLAVAAFLSIHRRVLPWVLLLTAAAPLIADVLLAVAY